MSTQLLSALGLGTPHPTWPDERLVQCCLAGEEAAWAALIQKYERLIYSIPFRYGARAEDAADVFQMVCIDLYAELPKLRKIDSLRSWLITVTARHSLRNKNSRQRYAGDDSELALQADDDAIASPAWMAAEEQATAHSRRLDPLELPPPDADRAALF
jgi:RNA polymerase sigma factor (sigma-70 family)